MIVYRQKLFWGAALNAGMAALTGAGLIQGHNQGKEAEKQAEETKAAIDRQTKALNKIAKEASKNPAVAQQVVAQKSFASPVLGFAKDLWKTQRGNVMQAGKMGLGFAGLGYAGNRIATSLKDHDTGEDKKNLNFLGKAAATATALGGTYMAAKHGKLPGLSAQANKNVARYMKSAGKAINPISRDANGSINKLGTGMNAFFVASPILGYMGQRKQIKDQARQSAQEKQYSDKDSGNKGKKTLAILGGLGATGLAIAGARRGYLGAGAQRTTGNIIAHTGGVLKSLGAKKVGNQIAKSGSLTYAKGVRDASKKALTGRDLINEAARKKMEAAGPAKLSGALNQVGSFFGFYGKGGTGAVQNTAKNLADSKNPISSGLGKWMQNHKTGANLLATAGTVGAGSAIMTGVQKPFEILDSHAYDMEKEQTKKIN